MIFVVLEDPRCPIFTEGIMTKFPQSSVVRVNKKSKITDLKKLTSKPLLTSKWLVFIDSKTESATLKFVGSQDSCICVYYTTSIRSKSDFNMCKSICNETEFIDNLNIGKENSISFIKSNINISDSDAEFLYNRCNKFLPYISESVNLLKGLQVFITRSHIQNYTPKHLNITPNTLFYNLVGIKCSDTKMISEYLYAYRYAFDYIYKSINALFSACSILYKDIESGELSNDNIEEYHANHANLNVSIYFIRTTLNEIYPSLSYGDLCIKRITIKKVKSILDLLSLF